MASAYEEGKSKGVKVNEFDINVGVEKGPVSANIGTTIGGWGAGSEKAFANASTQCDDNSKSKSFFNEIGLSQTDVISVGAPPYYDTEKWIEEVKESPSPAKLTLSPITDL